MPTKFQIDEYVTHSFIETGSGSGDNIIKALHMGFFDVYGIESSPTASATAHARIQDEMNRRPCLTNVTLYGGPSALAMQQACEKAQHKRATILLNLYSGEDGTVRPVLDEIRIAQRWFRETLMQPIIMISGIRQALDSLPGQQSTPALGELIKALLDLCEAYHFQILDDDISRNVLAALPPPWVQAHG